LAAYGLREASALQLRIDENIQSQTVLVAAGYIASEDDGVKYAETSSMSIFRF